MFAVNQIMRHCNKNTGTDSLTGRSLWQKQTQTQRISASICGVSGVCCGLICSYCCTSSDNVVFRRNNEAFKRDACWVENVFPWLSLLSSCLLSSGTTKLGVWVSPRAGRWSVFLQTRLRLICRLLDYSCASVNGSVHASGCGLDICWGSFTSYQQAFGQWTVL